MEQCAMPYAVGAVRHAKTLNFIQPLFVKQTKSYCFGVGSSQSKINAASMDARTQLGKGPGQ
jgi:hypothetical protein